jgi:Collagen triple helix repeat (20 copies)
MNKLVKLFSIIALSASITLVSCKGDKGDQGAPGPQGIAGVAGTNGTNGTAGAVGKDGTNGKNGSTNIVSFQKVVPVASWIKVTRSGVGGSATSEWGGSTILDPSITTGKYVQVFLKNGEEFSPLPISFTKDLDNSLERLEFGYKTGQLNIYYLSQTKLFGGTPTLKPSTDLTLDVLVIEKNLAGALEKSGVNMKSRKDILNFASTYN